MPLGWLKEQLKFRQEVFLGNCMICGIVWEAIADGLEEQVKTGSGRRIFGWNYPAFLVSG